MVKIATDKSLVLVPYRVKGQTLPSRKSKRGKVSRFFFVFLFVTFFFIYLQALVLHPLYEEYLGIFSAWDVVPAITFVDLIYFLARYEALFGFFSLSESWQYALATAEVPFKENSVILSGKISNIELPTVDLKLVLRDFLADQAIFVYVSTVSVVQTATSLLLAFFSFLEAFWLDLQDVIFSPTIEKIVFFFDNYFYRFVYLLNPLHWYLEWTMHVDVYRTFMSILEPYIEFLDDRYLTPFIRVPLLQFSSFLEVCWNNLVFALTQLYLFLFPFFVVPVEIFFLVIAKLKTLTFTLVYFFSFAGFFQTTLVGFYSIFFNIFILLGLFIHSKVTLYYVNIVTGSPILVEVFHFLNFYWSQLVVFVKEGIVSESYWIFGILLFLGVFTVLVVFLVAAFLFLLVKSLRYCALLLFFFGSSLWVAFHSVFFLRFFYLFSSVKIGTTYLRGKRFSSAMLNLKAFLSTKFSSRVTSLPPALDLSLPVSPWSKLTFQFTLFGCYPSLRFVALLLILTATYDPFLFIKTFWDGLSYHIMTFFSELEFLQDLLEYEELHEANFFSLDIEDLDLHYMQNGQTIIYSEVLSTAEYFEYYSYAAWVFDSYKLVFFWFFLLIFALFLFVGPQAAYLKVALSYVFVLLVLQLVDLYGPTLLQFVLFDEYLLILKTYAHICSFYGDSYGELVSFAFPTMEWDSITDTYDRRPWLQDDICDVYDEYLRKKKFVRFMRPVWFYLVDRAGTNNE